MSISWHSSLTGTKTGLTGASSEPESSSKSKIRPGFKELLAKYEKQGATQKKKKQPGEAKDMRSSSKHQEQSICCPHQGNYVAANYGLIAPWFHPYFYTPLDYSRMHKQSYYIQYPPMYPNHVSPQRPIVASNNLVKKDFDCSKEDEKSANKIFTAAVMSLRFDSYSKNEGCNVYARKKQWSNK